MPNDSSVDIKLVAHGHVRVETLSWMEAIRRKHGFDEATVGKSGAAAVPVQVGRTASARARAEAIFAELDDRNKNKDE